MPVKWTPQADQKLLLKILEASPGFTVNAARVSELWTAGDSADRPTPTAIKEHLRSLRRQFGIKTAIKTTASAVRITTGAVKVKGEPNDEIMADTQTPHNKKGRQNFIRSSFDTPFRSKPMKNKNGSKKRKRDKGTDEDEAMSTSGSESEADLPDTEPSVPVSTRASTRRRTTTTKFDFKDVLQSTESSDDTKDVCSSDSDGVFNPLQEYEKAKAARKNRGRPRRVGRLGEPELGMDEA